MNTAGCTTSWVNYANEPSQAALERSSQDAYAVIRLAAVWTLDSTFKNFINFFNFLPSAAYDSGMRMVDV